MSVRDVAWHRACMHTRARDPATGAPTMRMRAEGAHLLTCYLFKELHLGSHRRTRHPNLLAEAVDHAARIAAPAQPVESAQPRVVPTAHLPSKATRGAIASEGGELERVAVLCA